MDAVLSTIALPQMEAVARIVFMTGLAPRTVRAIPVSHKSEIIAILLTTVLLTTVAAIRTVS